MDLRECGGRAIRTGRRWGKREGSKVTLGFRMEQFVDTICHMR